MKLIIHGSLKMKNMINSEMSNKDMNNTEMNKLFDLLKLSLWDEGSATADEHIFDEMNRQTIAALPAAHLSLLGLPPELARKWKQHVFQQIVFNSQYQYIQSALPITVPYVILKGTAAAKYYPHPEFRTMGDIDIMTRREDVDKAYQELIHNGYQHISALNREISVEKNGIVIELHRRFASLNDPEQAKYLDDLLIEHINPSHTLPDPVNGIVLLEHVSQHLEDGLGLRQIIDWMMFVDRCLPDEKWPEFYSMVKNIGLEKLAVVITKMCEVYLGLPQREWCAGADMNLCRQLMDYVLNSGNFGNKRTTDDAISTNVFAHAITFKTAFTLLQNQGLVNWNVAQKYKVLRPFAWIYQAMRYAARGLKRDQAFSKINSEYSEAKKRNAMFKALGVKMKSKGIAVLKDGTYVRE